MRRKNGPILVSLIALLFCGCSSQKPIRYYTIQNSTAPPISNSQQSVSLVVGGLTGPDIFRASAIAYRVGTNEIGTYQYSRWSEPPVEMVRSSLIRMLKSSGDYQSVAALGSTSEGQFVVRGRLYDFEEVDGGSITGLVSMEFELYDRKSGKIVWSHFYSQSEPVEGKEISSIVSALEANLNRGLKEVAVGLNQYFSENRAEKF